MMNKPRCIGKPVCLPYLEKSSHIWIMLEVALDLETLISYDLISMRGVFSSHFQKY